MILSLNNNFSIPRTRKRSLKSLKNEKSLQGNSAVAFAATAFAAAAVTSDATTAETVVKTKAIFLLFPIFLNFSSGVGVANRLTVLKNHIKFCTWR